MGRSLGLDPGERRIGVAVSDPSGTIASPHGFIDTASDDTVVRLHELIAEFDIERIVVGLPVSLDGHEGPAARRARALGDEIAGAVDVPVHYHDERFTTVTAEDALIEGGVRRKERKEKRDQVAAAVMLQGYLDSRAHDGEDHDST